MLSGWEKVPPPPPEHGGCGGGVGGVNLQLQAGKRALPNKHPIAEREPPPSPPPARRRASEGDAQCLPVGGPRPGCTSWLEIWLTDHGFGVILRGDPVPGGVVLTRYGGEVVPLVPYPARASHLHRPRGVGFGGICGYRLSQGMARQADGSYLPTWRGPIPGIGALVNSSQYGGDVAPTPSWCTWSTTPRAKPTAPSSSASTPRPAPSCCPPAAASRATRSSCGTTLRVGAASVGCCGPARGLRGARSRGRLY